MEGTASFGPNMVSLILILGARIWYIMGACVPVGDVPAVHCMEQALRAAPKGLDIIPKGDLNALLEDPHDKREEELAPVLVDMGMVNMIYHFMPQQWYKGAGS